MFFCSHTHDFALETKFVTFWSSIALKCSLWWAKAAGERIPGKNISRVEPLNPRAVSGSAGTLAGEKFHGQLAGKGAGAPSFMGRGSGGRVRRLLFTISSISPTFDQRAASSGR